MVCAPYYIYLNYMSSRKAYIIHKAGNLNRLKKHECEIIPPGKGQVVVQVESIGLNFADIFAILGLYSATPEGAFIPGLEYAGRIIDTGSGVADFKKGDRVMGVTRFGAYTTHVTIDKDYVRLLPDDWSFDEGAGFLVQALTAYYGLFVLGDLKKEKTVLVHSAAGGVGLLANRMIQHTGAYAIGTVGSPGKLEVLRKEGYQGAIVRGRDFGKKLKEALHDRPLDLTMECISGNILKAGYAALSPMGRMVVYGSALYGSVSDTPNWIRLAWLYLRRPRVDVQKMIETNKAILGFNLIWLYDRKELMNDCMDEINAMPLEAPFIGHTFGFDELPEAIRLFQSGKTVGKVVVHITK